jgi:hypothetical protein
VEELSGSELVESMTLEPGDLVGLNEQPGCVFQLINLDQDKGCAWVRPWPLASAPAQTFSVTTMDLQQLEPVA